MQRVADLIAQELVRGGARFVAGVAGGETLALIDAFGRAGMRYVAVRHEGASGYVAEGAWRVGGSLPVVLPTIGPGVANIVNPVAHALQDRVPLIAIGGAAAQGAPRSFTHQVIPQVDLLAPVVKRAIRLTADDPRAQVRAAIRIALTPPQGPVYLDAPVDLMESLFEDRPARLDIPGCAAPPARDPSDLEERWARAKRPIALVGQGALDDKSAVRASLERLQCPVIQTYRAKGILDERSALVIGCGGFAPRIDALLLELCARADLALLIGYDPVETRAAWTAPFPSATSTIALASEEPGPALQSLITGVGSWADLHAVALTLGAREQHTAWRAEAASVRARIDQLTEAMTRSRPGALLAAVAPWIEEHAIRVAVDTGAHRILLSQLLRCREPERLFQSTGFCTMACALPLAIGAACADPTQPVLAVVGDGGIEMGLGELATLRDLKLPVIVLVLDDAGYALIDLKQRAAPYPSQGVRFCRSDYAGVARALGLNAMTVDEPAMLLAALEAARLAREPMMVHCPIPAESYDGIL